MRHGKLDIQQVGVIGIYFYQLMVGPIHNVIDFSDKTYFRSNMCFRLWMGKSVEIGGHFFYEASCGF